MYVTHKYQGINRMRQIKTWFSTHRLKHVLNWGIFDAFTIFFAYTIAFSSRALTISLDYQNSLGFIIFSIFITLMSLFVNGVYRQIWSRTSGHSIVILVRSVLFAFIILLILDLMFNPRLLPLSVLILGNIIAFGGIVIIRYRSRLIGAFEWRWRAIWKGEFPIDNRERVLIVGAGESGQAITLRLQHRIKTPRYNIVGFVDDDPQKFDMFIEGKPVLGKINDISKLVDFYKVELIVVAIHNIEGLEFRRILEICQETQARIKVVPNMIELMSSTNKYPKLIRDVQPEDLIGRTIITHHENVDLQPISNKTVLVTGAAGSIGSELCRQILEFEPTKLIILDCNESALHDLKIELSARHESHDVIAVLADVTHYSNLHAVFNEYNPEIVFHAAAYKHVPMLEAYPNEAIRVNIAGTLNVAELSVLYSVTRFVLISTDKAVKPSSIMGASKRICELIIHCIAETGQHDTIFTAVRFGNVLGSRGSVVPTFTRQIQNGGPITVTHQDMTRYFMSISEAVNLVLHAAAMTNGDDIFVLQMGEKVRILDIAERMVRLQGLRPYEDIPIEFTGIRPGEKLHEELHTSYETPLSTAHPKVMKLNKWMLNGQATSFIERVASLIQNGFPPDEKALQHLLDLCQIGEDQHTLIT